MTDFSSFLTDVPWSQDWCNWSVNYSKILKVSLQTWTIFIYGEKDFACNVENMDLVTMITDWPVCNL